MALQDNINAQLAQNRGKTVTQRDDIGFRYMAGNAVDGLMERNHFPGHIRVGLDGFFQKCLVFGNAQATGVQHHIQGVVVSKVVVAVTGRLRIHSVIAIGIAADLTVLFANVGQGKNAVRTGRCCSRSHGCPARLPAAAGSAAGRSGSRHTLLPPGSGCWCRTYNRR